MAGFGAHQRLETTSSALGQRNIGTVNAVAIEMATLGNRTPNAVTESDLDLEREVSQIMTQEVPRGENGPVGRATAANDLHTMLMVGDTAEDDLHATTVPTRSASNRCRSADPGTHIAHVPARPTRSDRHGCARPTRTEMRDRGAVADTARATLRPVPVIGRAALEIGYGPVAISSHYVRSGPAVERDASAVSCL